MELKDTIDLMLSSDFKDRFRAEYRQTEIRCEKLWNMIEKYKNGTLGFTPKCPIDLFEGQLSCMQTYLECLRQRARIEGINNLECPMKHKEDYIKFDKSKVLNCFMERAAIEKYIGWKGYFSDSSFYIREYIEKENKCWFDVLEKINKDNEFVRLSGFKPKGYTFFYPVEPPEEKKRNRLVIRKSCVNCANCIELEPNKFVCIKNPNIGNFVNIDSPICENYELMDILKGVEFIPEDKESPVKK